jgi:hypothetical protein
MSNPSYILFWTRQDTPSDINQKIYTLVKTNSPLNQYISTVCYDDMKASGDKLPPGVKYLPSIVIFQKNMIKSVIEPPQLVEFIKAFNAKLTASTNDNIPLDKRAMNLMQKKSFDNELSMKLGPKVTGDGTADYQYEKLYSLDGGNSIFGPLPDSNSTTAFFISGLSVDGKGAVINNLDDKLKDK